ncbi:MAG TPA: SCO family protein [Bacteroidales bacterium]|jgi:protein SCO1/2|nr:SCO family protein [Bacteroidales bacterium]
MEQGIKSTNMVAIGLLCYRSRSLECLVFYLVSAKKNILYREGKIIQNKKEKYIMKKLLFLIGAILLSMGSYAQPPAEDEVDVGIVEKLGDTLPLDLTFFNEQNDTVSLRELIDKPTILSFVYFDCPGLCSPLLSGVSEAVNNVDMELGKDYEVITISFNTKDTPEKANIKKRNFVQKIGEEQQKYWYYLTGTEENIQTITKAVGYKFKPQGVDFAHPSVIIMISPEGKITRYLYGLTYLPFDVKMAAIEAQKGLPQPSINKFLEVCFAYDPQGRTYTLQVTRIVGFLSIVIALIILTSLLIRGRRKTIKVENNG